MDESDQVQALMRNYDIQFTNEQDIFVQQSVMPFTLEQEAFIRQSKRAVKIRIDCRMWAYTSQAVSRLNSGSGEEAEASNPLVAFMKNTILTHLTTSMARQHVEGFVREFVTFNDVIRQITQKVTTFEKLMKTFESFTCSRSDPLCERRPRQTSTAAGAGTPKNGEFPRRLE